MKNTPSNTNTQYELAIARLTMIFNKENELLAKFNPLKSAEYRNLFLNLEASLHEKSLSVKQDAYDKLCKDIISDIEKLFDKERKKDLLVDRDNLLSLLLIEGSLFDEKLLDYSERLSTLWEHYQASKSIIKKDIKYSKQPFQKRIFIVKTLMNLVEELQVKVISFKSTSIVEDIQNLVVAYNNLKDRYNKFTTAYKDLKKIDEKKSLNEFNSEFNDRLENIKSIFSRISMYYNVAEKFTKELEQIFVEVEQNINNTVKFKSQLFENYLSELASKVKLLLSQIIPQLAKLQSTESEVESKKISLPFFAFNKSASSKILNDIEKSKVLQKSSLLNLAEKLIKIREIALKSIVFGLEYQYLNQAYKRLVLNNEYSEIKRWLVENNKLEHTNSDSVDISDFIIQLGIKDYLPDQYSTKFYCFGDIKFPSSIAQHLPGWSGHIDGNIIATAGPGWHKEDDNLKIFIAYLFANKPAQILSLGRESADNKENDFTNYIQRAFSENTSGYRLNNYTIKVIARKNCYKVTIDKDNESYSFYYNNLKVFDNKSINLDNEGLRGLLHIYNNVDKDHKILIHCASGVGRTGQLRLLFGLLDRLKNDIKFSQNIDTLIMQSKKDNLGYDYVAQVFKQELCRIRKIRYAIQVSEQYVNCFPLLLMLRAVQLNMDEENINLLRQALSGTFIIEKNAQMTFTDFTCRLSDDINLLTNKPIEEKLDSSYQTSFYSGNKDKPTKGFNIGGQRKAMHPNELKEPEKSEKLNNKL
jgi:protein tyrosine phosphatase